MGKIFIKYLSFLGILLLATATNFSANSVDKDAPVLTAFQKVKTNNPISLDSQENSTTLSPLNQEHQNNLLFDIAEVEEIENEEFLNDDANNITDCFTASNNAQLFNYLSFQLKKEKSYYKKYFNESSTKLHIRLQVFII